MPNLFFIYLLLLSCIAFVLYGLDKQCARHRAFRISEAALLSVGFFGGAFGAILAMQLFRHKTKHRYFYMVNGLGILWQVIVLICLF